MAVEKHAAMTLGFTESREPTNSSIRVPSVAEEEKEEVLAVAVFMMFVP